MPLWPGMSRSSSSTSSVWVRTRSMASRPERRLGHHADVVVLVEEGAQRAARDGVVIRNAHADRAQAPLPRGQWRGPGLLAIALQLHGPSCGLPGRRPVQLALGNQPLMRPVGPHLQGSKNFPHCCAPRQRPSGCRRARLHVADVGQSGRGLPTRCRHGACGLLAARAASSRRTQTPGPMRITKGVTGRPVRRAHSARTDHRASSSAKAASTLAAKTRPAASRSTRQQEA